jgi:hypothetical protein
MLAFLEEHSEAWQWLLDQMRLHQLEHEEADRQRSAARQAKRQGQATQQPAQTQEGPQMVRGGFAGLQEMSERQRYEDQRQPVREDAVEDPQAGFADRRMTLPVASTALPMPRARTSGGGGYVAHLDAIRAQGRGQGAVASSSASRLQDLAQVAANQQQGR